MPELMALLLGLSIYTASFIAEIVRAGILGVPKGQTEAAQAIGLSKRTALRLVVIPQALRIIIPPLTSQYLNLTKNSSLAVAIGYPDFVSVFTGTVLNQTGQAVEVILMTMGVFLTLSLAHLAVHELVQQPHRAGGAVAMAEHPLPQPLPPAAAHDRRPARVAARQSVLVVGQHIPDRAGPVARLPGHRRPPSAGHFCTPSGRGRTASVCSREGAGACWPFVADWFGQFMYGRYPDAERWRVNLTYVLALAGLVPLMVPPIPGKLWSSIYLIAVFPVLATDPAVGWRARPANMCRPTSGAACW